MSAGAARQIAAVARKHDIAIIENDVLGPLVEDRPPPIAAFAPERTLYVTSFTKITVPGLRIGYLAAPDRYVAAVANRHLVSNWMATPMVAEIAIEMGERRHGDGTGPLAARGARAAPGHRRGSARRRRLSLAPQRLHVWLPLPGDRTEEGFVAQARLQGVGIAPGLVLPHVGRALAAGGAHLAGLDDRGGTARRT